MKRIFKAYRELIGILFEESPFVVISVFAAAVLTGVILPVSVWVNSRIFDLGLSVASGGATFAEYIPYLVMFVVLALLPVLAGDLFIYSYAEPRCQLILRTAYKGKMLRKLKRLRYEHLESEESMEIIDKAYNRTENSARHLFPMYLKVTISSIIASIGTLYLFFTVRWWLLLTILLPFALETWFSKSYSFDIYDQLEKYWNKERQYSSLGNMLKSRDYIKENRLFGASGFLIGTYRKRLAARNREYEQYYFKHLRRRLTQRNVVRLAQIGNALILLMLYIRGDLNIGLLIALTLTIFTTLFTWDGLSGCAMILMASGYHIKFFDFYDKYFSLSEDEYGDDRQFPDDFTVEFRDVHFTYPGTDKKILNGLTFKVGHGEKISVVGENGEGKTTMVKLLLGLFQPDNGEILIGGKPLQSYTQAVRNRLFGPVFQDFVKYSVTLGENVGVGDVDKVHDAQAVAAAMSKAKADVFAQALPDGVDTLLGRDFEGGVDLSGGQWQRVAIARAFMGDKPILILDEPTSQLDPMAESLIYSEFAEMSEGKTAVFITHRLGSTMITDRILVIADGHITQSGSHADLMEQGGLYADMFNSQKQWYINHEEGAETDG